MQFKALFRHALIVCSLSVVSAAWGQQTLAFNDQCRIPHYAFTLNCLTLPANTLGEQSHFDVQVYKVDARVRYPKPTPVIWLPDGLGMVPTERAPLMLSTLSRLRNFREFIWLEFKPAKNKPTLTCQTEAELKPSFQKRLYRLNDIELITQCTNTIQAFGGVKQVDYHALAQTYERMAQQLNLQQVTVVAEGRGALIANAWQTIAPKRIAFAVFDSPPRLPDAQEALLQAEANAQALQKVFSACEAEKRCRDQFKHQEADWLALQKSLPVTTRVKDPITLKSTDLTITNDMLAMWTGQLLRNPNKSRYLPLFLTHAVAGNWQPFIGTLTYPWQKDIGPVNHALAIAEQCAYRGQTEADNTQKNSLSPLANWFYQSDLARSQAMCAGLERYHPQTLTWQASKQMPTLVLMGLANPAIDPNWQNTATHTVIQAPGAGHGVLNHACTRDVIVRYFKWQDDSASGGKTKAFEADCLLKLPYPSMSFSSPERSASIFDQTNGVAP